MNKSILLQEVQDLIQENLNTDITKLVLKGSPFDGITTHELIEQIEAKKRCLKKLPNWYNTKNIYFPNKLNIEQTSSEATANYKSSLISGNSIIDVTGGFGVDDIAFSKHFNKVTHCELNTILSTIVSHNLQQFDVQNITTVAGNGIDYIVNNTQNYDWIYIDPSRRNDIKGKVFLLKDCLPNVPLHLNELLKKSNHILIKNSPLMDITSCIKELQFVKQIHIIALHNEVKEVLVFIEKNYCDEITIKATNLTTKNQTFSFIYQQEYNYELSNPLNYLYEPNSAILKSGGFSAIAHQYQLKKLHKHSHLYTSNENINFPGRKFEIQEILPYNKKELLKKIPNKKANITTRNFKESVASIRKKTKIKDGGDIYLFFTTNHQEEQIVVICKKIISKPT